MNNGHYVWSNMIAYPEFEVDDLDDKSLFWRIEATHPFYTVIKNGDTFNLPSGHSSNSVGKGVKLNNYYHKPVVIRNGLWGSRIFLESEEKYTISMSYKSSIRLYLGLYEHNSHTPLKNWVLNPARSDLVSNGIVDWQDTFSLNNKSFNRKPLHLKIIIPDTGGEFVELAGIGLFLAKSHVDIDLSVLQLPEIAIGIVTYNRKKYIAALLNQIRSINYPADKLRIFVVDNASTDGTDTLLQQEFPEVTVLRNSENLGGAGGFNRFFKHLAAMPQHSINQQKIIDEPPPSAVKPEWRDGYKGTLPPFAWLIDDDAVIDKNTLIYLVRAALNDDSIAVAGSVMMDLENTSTVYEAGGDLFKDRFGWDANILNTDAQNLMHVNEKIWSAGYAGAYSLLFRTEVIRQVGIWRDYFLHVDDCEWCIRIKRMTGKRVVIALDSLIWHVLQGAKKPFTTLRYYETRNFLDYFAGRGCSLTCDNVSEVSIRENNDSEGCKLGYSDKRALLKVMIQTILMGLKQLAIKRDDLCHFHIKGIEDFFEGRFGKQALERSALFCPDIQALLDEYKKDENNSGRYPTKVFIVREINRYMNDGIDYEGTIVSQIRAISPQTTIVDASINHNIRNPFLLKIVVILKMFTAFFMPSEGVVILPFWNESVIPNNLAKYTAVFENGQYSLYKAGRMKAIGNVFKILWKSFFNALRIFRNRFDPKASHVSF